MTADYEFTFGRNRKLQLATCFAVDKNRKLMLSQEYKDKEQELEGQVNVVALDIKNDLVEQLDEMDTKPDIIISKLHKALGSRGDPMHDACLGNYDEMMRSKYKDEFNKLNLIPLACERVLVDRYNMVAFLKRLAAVVRVVNNNGCGCESPKWTCCKKGEQLPSADLPPFPIVVKPKSTAVKQMGVVFNKDGLRAFTEAAPCDEFSLEQYVPHSGVVYKIYVIAQHIFVGGRPSLPDLESTDTDTLKAYAEEIKGSYVEYETSEKCNAYITFFSDVITNRAGRVECKRLVEHMKEESSDLDFNTVNIFKLAMELEWNVELFGFDVLVDKNTKTHYVVDANVLPGFKGVDKYLFHMNKLFIRHGIRHGLKLDIAQLNRNDHALKSYCIGKLDAWKANNVQPDELVVRRLVDSRIFQVKFNKGVRKDMELRKALVTFYNWEKPRRIIHDEINFIGNVAKGLFRAGLGPVQYHDINASYYGCERYLGRIEQWVSGMTLLKALNKKNTDSTAMFRCLGDIIARFHNVIKDKDFKDTIVDYHFQKLEGVPLCFTLLEVWRRCALISAERSELKHSDVWSGFYSEFIKRKDIEEVKKVVLGRLKSRFSTQIVFSHFDVNLSNAIVNDNENPTLVTLIDIEWCGPSLAVYDFAKLISSLEIQIQRKEVNLTLDEVPHLLRTVVTAYLDRMGVFCDGMPEAEKEQHINDFVDDCNAFVPIACILNVYSNLIHASFDGQLENITTNTALGKRGDDFNWIRHASDHFNAFKKYYERLEN
eukprot:TRINITY_DN13206_c1_g1_i1.p1 TRINITY_DN13206_c1_g1~~TRINITY_DN13206_c1_g1_i1.p1  ORF type:complete len:769 (+),score=230.06 TRINITY_DN13206_c1_g1_i1:127-2433(+)